MIRFIFLAIVLLMPLPKENDRFIITAAHTESEDVPIYVDSDRDIAIYINEDFKPVVPPYVIVRGYIGRVVKTDSNGFYVKIKDSTVINAGWSGSNVSSITGTVLGFVSFLEDGYIYCVAI